MDNPRIRITDIQKNQLEEIRQKHNLRDSKEVLDILLKNNKRFVDLENKVKHVHMITKL